ncbi:MAG: lipoate--protein ligase family protein [Fibrobacter sp.]|nr:lipoate--protein ligase family protein [Fibrobacter sp.]
MISETVEHYFSSMNIPLFPGELRKNDALFLYGAVSGENPFVFTYVQKGTEVVHGPSCHVADEINIDACRMDNVRIVARRGGGGTVVLSDGMCITIVVGRRHGRYAQPIFDSIHHSMIAALLKAGVKGCECRGISDIAINNKKVLGSSLYLGNKPDYFYYQSSFMVASDIALISRYLRYPPKEPDYRRNRDHGDFCTALVHEGYTIGVDTVAELFCKEITDAVTVR